MIISVYPWPLKGALKISHIPFRGLRGQVAENY